MSVFSGPDHPRIGHGSEPSISTVQAERIASAGALLDQELQEEEAARNRAIASNRNEVVELLANRLEQTPLSALSRQGVHYKTRVSFGFFSLKLHKKATRHCVIERQRCYCKTTPGEHYNKCVGFTTIGELLFVDGRHGPLTGKPIAALTEQEIKYALKYLRP